MRKFTVAVLMAVGLVLGMSSLVMAANATATAGGEVIVPITITSNADLEFGKFAAGTTGGTIKVDTDGTLTPTGGATGVIVATGSTGTAAQFAVTGQTLNTYSIAHSGTTTLTSGTDTMALAKVSALTAASGTTTEVSTGTLSVLGAQTIFVGGTLTVGAAQAQGVYAGTVIVTVEYN